jgi:hypothetical protein
MSGIDHHHTWPGPPYVHMCVCVCVCVCVFVHAFLQNKMLDDIVVV